jgi:hypothetical protein
VSDLQAAWLGMCCTLAGHVLHTMLSTAARLAGGGLATRGVARMNLITSSHSPDHLIT